jgi:EAL domain-containing protein (putative c-di-GMP-specific phosphodiesterase class I)
MTLPDSALPSARTTLIVGGPLLAFALLFGWQSWASSKADQVQQLQTVAESTERAIDRYLTQTQSALAVLTEDIATNDGLANLAATQKRLVRFEAEHSELLAANLLGFDGQVLATSATPALTGLPTAGNLRDFAQIVASQRVDTPMQLGQPLFGPTTKRWILPIRYALRDGQGKLTAIVVASAPVEMLQTFWSKAPVVSKACRAASNWPVPRDGKAIQLAVNVSPIQLKERRALVASIADALASSGLPPARLEIEITESALIGDALETLQSIKALGVSLSLDDFGTGYSSLSQLVHYPFDRLKIDRSFVRELPVEDEVRTKTGTQARWMMQAIASLGSGLGMSTVAEGVETEAQADLVREAGVALLQGYLIARPTPQEDVAALIQRLDDQSIRALL